MFLKVESISCLREVGALPAYASGEGSGVEVQKDWKVLTRRGLRSLLANSQNRAASMRTRRYRMGGVQLFDFGCAGNVRGVTFSDVACAKTHRKITNYCLEVPIFKSFFLMQLPHRN